MLIRFDELERRIESLPDKQVALGLLTDHVVVGDCLEVLGCLPDACVDLIHTSPPYNIAKPYKGKATDLSPLEAYERFLACAIHECKRVLKPNGSLFWQTGYTQLGNGTGGDILPIDILTYRYFRESPTPMILWDRIIWRYFGGRAFKKKFTNKHETILWYVKPGEDGTADPYFMVDEIRERSKELDKRNNFWGRNPGNVWEVDRVAAGSTDQSSHIAVYPEEITEKIVRACSRPGDFVLDPFSGSGTTPKVAQSLGRRWLGIEISEEYAAESVVRLGYQQPSETWSLASSIIKFEVFGGKRGTLAISQVADRLRWWLRTLGLESLRGEFERTVAAAISDETPSKAGKRLAWMAFDSLLQAGNGDPVVRADGYLAEHYKNRRNLNGAMRYKTALETVEGLVALVRQYESRLGELVKKIADEEPSSFAVAGDMITLRQVDKRLKEAGTAEPSASALERLLPPADLNKGDDTAPAEQNADEGNSFQPMLIKW